MKFPKFWSRDSDAAVNQGIAAPEDQVGMHGPSPVLDDKGQPVAATLSPEDKAVLGEQIAEPELIGYRSFWDQSVARGLTPEKLAGILQQTKRGDIRAFLELAEEMEERDLHYASVLGTRKRQVARLVPSIEEDKARGVDKKIIMAVRELVEAPEFRQLKKDLVDSFGKGFAASETVWAQDGALWKPAAYLRRDPKFFTFDYISRTEVRLAEMASIDGVALPPAKFIVHKPQIKSGIPIRGGFAWIACWSWLFKQYTLKDWVSFLDIFGMPIRVGKYHPSATAEERRKLLQAVSRIAVDAAAIIPESMVIEFLEAKANAAAPFKELGDYLDKQMSKLILGQTMTTDGQAGGLAQAKVHDEVRIDILEDDADELAVTINRDLIAWFVKLNFGDQAKAPIVRFPVAEPQDIAVKSTAITQLVGVGLKVSQAAVREIVGLPEPEDDDELLEPPAAKAAAAPKVDADTSQAVRMAATNAELHGLCPCGCGQRLALNAEGVEAATEPDVIDQIGFDEAAEWEAVLSPMVEAVLKAVEKAQSFEEFSALLDGLAAEIDVDPLAKRLMVSAMKARGFGLGSGPEGRL